MELTQALGIDLTALVEGAGDGEDTATIEIVSRNVTPEMASSDGSCRLKVFSPPHMAGVTEWYELTIQPGGSLDSAAHSAGAFEHLTVREGSLSVSSGSATQTVDAGETARYPADISHRIANEGRSTGPGVARGGFSHLMVDFA